MTFSYHPNEKKYMKRILIAVLLLLFRQVLAQSGKENIQQQVKHQIRSGNYKDALSILETVQDIGNDTTGLFDALINLYFLEKDWTNIIHAYSLHTFLPFEDSTTLSIARFCAVHPAEKIVLKQPIHIPFKPFAGGTPIVEVKVNGHTYHFWLDTGAGMTVLSSATAQQCGIKQNSASNAVAIAATGKALELDPGLMDSLEINSLKVYNHPCIILNTEDLAFKILGIQLLKIDGIIGWNLLQELDIAIDNKSDSVTIDLPDSHHSDAHNFCWLGEPLITCTDSKGDSCLFFFDSGAAGPGIYTPFLSAQDTMNAKKKTMLMGSAGGVKKSKTWVLPLVKLQVAGQPVELKHVFVHPNDKDKLLPSDGVLGIKEFGESTIHFNMRKGFFEIKN